MPDAQSDGHYNIDKYNIALVARFIGPTWGPSGADRTQVGPMLAPWTLLSGCIPHSTAVTEALPGRVRFYTHKRHPRIKLIVFWENWLCYEGITLQCDDESWYNELVWTDKLLTLWWPHNYLMISVTYCSAWKKITTEKINNNDYKKLMNICIFTQFLLFSDLVT